MLRVGRSCSICTQQPEITHGITFLDILEGSLVNRDREAADEN